MCIFQASFNNESDLKGRWPAAGSAVAADEGEGKHCEVLNLTRDAEGSGIDCALMITGTALEQITQQGLVEEIERSCMDVSGWHVRHKASKEFYERRRTSIAPRKSAA